MIAQDTVLAQLVCLVERIPAPTTPRFALGAVFVYQLALLRRHEWNLDSNGGLKAFLGAA
jgi:hypothetical protein